MIWKPKAKELTQDEAIELAKKELSPFWYGSSPQIAGIKTDDGYVVLPLDPQFAKKSWLMFFIDPTDYSGQAAEIYAKEWFRRYSNHHLSTLLVLLPVYRFWQIPENINRFTESQQILFPIVVDVDQAVSGSFGALVPPKVLLLHQGHHHFEHSGMNWLSETEPNIQHFLRAKDPGLALLPVFQPSKPIIQDIKRMEFGYGPRLGKEVEYEKPGFLSSERGYRLGRFHGLKPKKLKEDQLFISGEWLQDSEKIATGDPNACLSFMNTCSHLSLVAQSLAKNTEIPTISVEVNGTPVYDSIAGENLTLEESGASVVKVRQAQIYHVLKNLPAQEHEITFRFPNASLASLAIYGIRFGNLKK